MKRPFNEQRKLAEQATLALENEQWEEALFFPPFRVAL